eukprot:1944157-Lingulodinium_polyedra.AAC.1
MPWRKRTRLFAHVNLGPMERRSPARALARPLAQSTWPCRAKQPMPVGGQASPSRTPASWRTASL